ncbi:hypothetical protein KJ628_06180, partial [Patescibacteria group bacterium]|nr:hypothetical protein [Patescibacteria group bacterium]
FLQNHPDYVLVGSQADIIDEYNQIIGEKKFPIAHDNIYEQYGTIHPILHPAIMVRRSMLPHKNKLWANQAEPNDDYFTLINLIKHGKFHNLPQKLMQYRMHADNKSLNGVNEKFINTLKIRAHAVKNGYPLTAKMILTSLFQAMVVLPLPGWLVVGTFLWIKGMKPFDQAFPWVATFKQKITQITKLQPRWDYAFPLIVLITLRTLIKKTH